MDKTLMEELERIVGGPYVVTNIEQMRNYLADETPPSERPRPADNLVLIKPADAQQVASVLRLASKSRVAVFPRGGGTGLVGGAVPTTSGIILSMERMNGIEIDEANLLAIADAGVTLGGLMSAAEEVGLSFPPHPGDENAQVGGLAATNAGGSRAVRHGVMRSQVRGMEVVLPTGEILNLGGRLHKDNVGYDLMQLIIGSEGTLAVVTKVILRLYPKPGATMTLIVPYNNRHDALSSVPKILHSSTPLAVEYVERELVERSAKRLNANWPVKTGRSHLIIIMAEPSRDQVLSESLKVAKICQENTTYETFVAESKSDQDNILRIRSDIYFALKSETMDLLDITVPTAELEKVMEAIEDVATRRAAVLQVFGHAADGNLHVHIMKKEGEDAKYVEDLRDEIYEIAMRAGGVITGEHGIGKIRAKKLESLMTSKEFELMKSIKRIFDPDGILNPGTKIPV
jgi:glycolate dehydrogenase FAD-linked subunit